MTFNQDLEQWLVSEQRHFHQASNNAKARRPHVTLTYAQSWDGSIASDPGTPMALSGDESLRMTHQLRSLHDGILVGIGTVLADDPRLNVRKWSGRDPQPIVLDSHLRMPPSSRLCQRGDHGCWVLTTVASADNRHDCEPIVVPGDEEGHVNLHEALQLLYQRGINTLMVEGGASVITAFLREGLADAVVLTVAPVFIGGYNAIGSSKEGDRGLPRIVALHSHQLDDELVVWGRLDYADQVNQAQASEQTVDACSVAKILNGAT
ncbi:RibD family protein [Marinimicrobium sp. LS-A18]|uniref:RibD family protein n=1 Tax=Marinimicrobium sp. LS-A18 TaxID=1381596 RepID=UPI0004644D2B|nr:RibD family protein [Marinimicrobium sp. LS-A18]